MMAKNKLHIEWRHYARAGKTCERCQSTKDNLDEIIPELNRELQSRGVTVTQSETVLGKDQIAESNGLLFNGVPLENLIEKAHVSESECQSCSCLAGQPTNCRTVEIAGETHETIPKTLIRKAAFNALGIKYEKEPIMMLKLEVFDPPMCCSTGVCGPEVDPKLARFAGDLEWLKRNDINVARYNMAQQPKAFVDSVVVKQELDARGNACLPLILANGRILASGFYPQRGDLQSALATFGFAPHEAEEEDGDESCCGSDEDSCDEEPKSGCCG